MMEDKDRMMKKPDPREEQRWKQEKFIAWRQQKWDKRILNEIEELDYQAMISGKWRSMSSVEE